MPAMVPVVRIVLVASVLGCGSRPSAQPPSPGSAAIAPAPDAAPPALDRDLPRLAERGVKLYEEVAQAFRAAGEDCGAASASLGELRRSYGDVTAANQQVLHDGRAKELKAALAAYDDRLEAAARAIIQSPTMARCAQDPAFSSAFDDLVGAPP